MLYKNLFYFFLAKENKLQTLRLYYRRLITRGGTFWGWYFYVLVYNYVYSTFRADGWVYALNMFEQGLIFLPIGLTYGMLRELYYDYESTNRK